MRITYVFMSGLCIGMAIGLLAAGKFHEAPGLLLFGLMAAIGAAAQRKRV
jgi:hypothetical protein